MFSPPLLLFKSNINPSCSSREGNNAALSPKVISSEKDAPFPNPEKKAIEGYMLLEIHDLIIKPAWIIKATVKDKRNQPGSCSAVGGNICLDILPSTRLKASQGNAASAPARDFQGLCPYFGQMKDFGEVLSVKQLSENIRKSGFCRAEAGVGTTNKAQNTDLGLLSGK